LLSGMARSTSASNLAAWPWDDATNFGSSALRRSPETRGSLPTRAPVPPEAQPVVAGILEFALGGNAAFGNECKLQAASLCSHGDASSSRPGQSPAFKSSCAFSVSAGMKPDVAIETFHIDSPKARIAQICKIDV
jgi:hypothetical protein